jgi:hypothetical protein
MSSGEETGRDEFWDRQYREKPRVQSHSTICGFGMRESILARDQESKGCSLF